jgi:hypothetical protein
LTAESESYDSTGQRHKKGRHGRVCFCRTANWLAAQKSLIQRPGLETQSEHLARRHCLEVSGTSPTEAIA